MLLKVSDFSLERRFNTIFVSFQILILFLLDLELLLIQLLELFHALEVVEFHFLHGLSIFVFLFGFLELEVLVSFVELVQFL